MAMENDAFIPVADSELVSAWEGPVPVEPGREPPMVWLLGAHGGAGVTTLAHLLGVAGDCWRRWPSGRLPDQESPYVVLVAGESRTGLEALARLVRQYGAGQASAATVLGLVTVATSKGKRPKELEHHIRNLEGAGLPLWTVPFVDAYRLHLTDELPVWTPGAEYERPRRPDPMIYPLPQVEQLGDDLIEHVRSALTPTSKEN